MIICTATVEKAIERALGTSLVGVGVHVLPDEAFEGLMADDGGPSNMLLIKVDPYKVCPNWKKLKKGLTTLRQEQLKEEST